MGRSRHRDIDRQLPPPRTSPLIARFAFSIRSLPAGYHVGLPTYAPIMNGPLTMSWDDITKASDEELIVAYERDGLSRAEAEATVAEFRKMTSAR